MDVFENSFNSSLASAINFMDRLPQMLTGIFVALIMLILVRAIARAVIVGMLGTDGRFVISLIEVIAGFLMAAKAYNQPAVIFTVTGWCAGLAYAFLPGYKNLFR